MGTQATDGRTSGSDQPCRPLRADAARNREKLLEAATEVFAEHGTEGSLEEIARRAGVGVGTLYRHFPTRACLVEQVYRHSVDEVCAAAPRLLEQLDPFDALATWVDGFVGYVSRKKGMTSALREAMGPDSDAIFADVHERLEGAASLLLGAAQQAGMARTDAEPLDILRSVSGMCMAAAASQDPERTKRVLALVLDGLRYGAPAAEASPRTENLASV
ncbi:TetR family transcriptional regulator [Luteimicrobium album]|uniref:TetR family transcriptional regulator n=1 Tax=Luteimicrobium album TaxID=1054550 RepID=A0ABQ6I0Q2_9MICO|nr:TetR/AcrR family transcriptional regulator [Luteimicrobium album]GMA23807.1 TetR family transcriptional regulator [Luteimicrobium album]